MYTVERTNSASHLLVDPFAHTASSEPSEITHKIATEWEKLLQYIKHHKEAYFLKFLVKNANKKNDDASRFQSLFSELKKNLFGGDQFLPSEVSYLAADYIQVERRLRDFDLMIFWNHLRKEHPHLNLPALENANQIRSYLETDQAKVHQITILRMDGIFEVWPEWHQKYGSSLGFPAFETEREIHQYLENPKNMSTIIQVIAKERETILEKTTRLPPEIKYFINLESLTFSNRKSLVLPKAIFKLEKLKVLNVRHSELHKLSKQIALLTNLQRLCLIGTQFVGLPEAIRQLNSLQIRIENKTEMELSSSMRSFLAQHVFSSKGE